MPPDPLAKLLRANRRQQSDVAQKLISMCLHEMSSEVVRAQPRLRVDTDAYKEIVRAHFGSTCAFCESALGNDCHVEHLDAMNRVRAGLHIAGNVVLSCKRCNNAKRNDDQARGPLTGHEGWRNFLSHAGVDCAPGCSTCQHWREKLPDDSTRASLLQRRRERIDAFRSLFSVDTLRDASLSMVQDLERRYREAQDTAKSGTEAFVEQHLPALLSAIGAPEPARAHVGVAARAIPHPTTEIPHAAARAEPPDRLPRVEAPIVPAPNAGATAFPSPLTVASLDAYLRSMGFEVQNNRPADGGLWVKSEARFDALREQLTQIGLDVRLATRRKVPGDWYVVDGKKVLR